MIDYCAKGENSMINREMETAFNRVKNFYPVVTITGPRQAGKTTFAKMMCPDYKYVNLESTQMRRLAESDMEEFFKRYNSNVIIDEVQNVPEVLSMIQALVDEERTPCRFIVTGSKQFGLMSSVKQSLAGRTAVFSLSPFSISEIKASGLPLPDRNELLLRGFMPQLWTMPQMEAHDYYRMYFETYVERDVSQLRQIQHRNEFDTFVHLLAGRVGQILNLASLSNDTGVSSQTLREWLTVLEASHIIYLLRPYYANLGKRLIKAPKIYFYEPGLAAWLLSAATAESIGTLPQLGGLFENMVIMEVVKSFENNGERPQVSFYRDSNQREIDLIIESGRSLIPIEIKSARTFSFDMCSNVTWFTKNVPSAKDGFVVYAGTHEFQHQGCTFVNYQNFNRTKWSDSTE